MKPNRAEGRVWHLRRGDSSDFVTTASGDRIVVHVDEATLVTDRRKARLLARRINECLDETGR